MKVIYTLSGCYVNFITTMKTVIFNNMKILNI